MKHIASISFTTSAGPVGNTHKEHAALLAHRFLDPYFCRSRENYDTMSWKTCEIVKFNHKCYLDRIIYIYIYIVHTYVTYSAILYLMHIRGWNCCLPLDRSITHQGSCYFHIKIHFRKSYSKVFQIYVLLPINCDFIKSWTQIHIKPMCLIPK